MKMEIVIKAAGRRGVSSLCVLGFTVALSASGCGIAYTSNDPDSGINCDSTDGGQVATSKVGGTGALSGVGAFSVMAAYEASNYSAPVPDASTSQEAHFLVITLYSNAVTCGEFAPRSPKTDGGAPLNVGQALELWLYNSADSTDYSGDYVIGQNSGQYAEAWLFTASGSVNDAGMALPGAGVAVSGTVHIDTEAACSLTGTFALTLGLPDAGTVADGGTYLSGVLSGSFAPVYCTAVGG